MSLSSSVAVKPYPIFTLQRVTPGYGLAYVNHSQTTPWVQVGISKPEPNIPKVWVGLDFICQAIPWVQFGYNLCMLNHTLGTASHGEMGMPVTPAAASGVVCGHSSWSQT